MPNGMEEGEGQGIEERWAASVLVGSCNDVRVSLYVNIVMQFRMCQRKRQLGATHF